MPGEHADQNTEIRISDIERMLAMLMRAVLTGDTRELEEARDAPFVAEWLQPEPDVETGDGDGEFSLVLTDDTVVDDKKGQEAARRILQRLRERVRP